MIKKGSVIICPLVKTHFSDFKCLLFSLLEPPHSSRDRAEVYRWRWMQKKEKKSSVWDGLRGQPALSRVKVGVGRGDLEKRHSEHDSCSSLLILDTISTNLIQWKRRVTPRRDGRSYVMSERRGDRGHKYLVRQKDLDGPQRRKPQLEEARALERTCNFSAS